MVPDPGAAEDVNLLQRLQEHWLARTGATFGVGGGFLAVGMLLLPSSSWAQSALIVVASGSLGVAVVAGHGAWRSGGRFALVSGSTAVALISLAGLSVVTETPVQEARPPTTAPSGESGNDIEDQPTQATRSPSASSTPSPKPSSARVSLTTLQPANVSDTGFGDPEWSTGVVVVNGVEYQDAVIARFLSDSFVEYPLSARFARFTAVIGFVDDTEGTAPVSFELEIDGEVVESGTIEIGRPVEIDMNVRGAIRMVVRAEYTGSGRATIALGDPQLEDADD